MAEHPLDLRGAVLADEDHRQAPAGGQVQGLLHPALVGGALAEEGHGDPAVAPQLVGQGVAGDHGDAPPDDPVRSQGAYRGIEGVVGARLALVEARPLAAQLGHQQPQVASLRDEVPEGPVGAPDLVPGSEVGADADRNGLLPRVEAEPGGDLPLPDEPPRPVLEGPDAYHLPVEIELHIPVGYQIETLGNIVSQDI